MGNFLIVLASAATAAPAEELHRRAVLATSQLKNQQARKSSVQASKLVTVFERQNSTAGHIASDPATGAWILAQGTWFHNDGYGVGQEERLLRALLGSKTELVARQMEGFFLVAFGSPGNAETTLFTDTMGSCHAYLRHFPEVTAIAGSSLVLAALAPTAADPLGCQEFVQTGISYEDRTHYAEVRKLDPATVYRFSGERLEDRKRYWSYRDLEPNSLGSGQAVDALWHALGSAATNIERHFPRVSCDLTGGYDSRSVLSGFLGRSLPVSAAVSGPPDKPDVRIAKSLAASLGLPIVHTLPMERFTFDAVHRAHALTDGEFDPVEYAQILHVQSSLSKSFDISLNGSYGGIARALWWEVMFPHIGQPRALDARRLAVGRYLAPDFEPALFRSDIRIAPSDHLTAVIGRYLNGLEGLPNTMQMDAVNLAMRIHRWQGRIASSTHQIWPCLSPFGLRSVLEVVLRSDYRLRLRSKLVRQMLAAHQPQMANFVLDRGYPAAPVGISNFYRFLPVFTHFARRGVRKIFRTISRSSSGRSPTTVLSPRLQLWSEERTAELLRPAAMTSAFLFDPETLEAFLRKSQGQEFPFTTQWNRLLSLELSFRAVERFEVPRQADFPGGELKAMD